MRLHDPVEVGMDPAYAARTATRQYRTTPRDSSKLGAAANRVLWALLSCCPAGAIIDMWLDPIRDVGLSQQGLAQADVDHWLVHPGGPGIIEAYDASMATLAGTVLSIYVVQMVLRMRAVDIVEDAGFTVPGPNR